MKNSFAAIVLATLATTSIAEAGISSHSSSKLNFNPVPIEYIDSIASFNLAPFVSERNFSKTVTPTADAAPIRVAWSIKSVAKKAGKGIKKGVKKAGKGVKKGVKIAGRGIKKANRVIVPSEIRNTASKAKRGAVNAGRCIAKGGCGYIGDLPPGARGNIHDHRANKTSVHDHRTSKIVVHDHRTNKVVVHDHRTAKQTVVVTRR